MDEDDLKQLLQDIQYANVFYLLTIIEATAKTLVKHLEQPPHGDLTETARDNGLAHGYRVLASAHALKASPSS